MREDIKINDRALALGNQIIDKLEKVYDTDVELDVYNLGLIYEIHLDEAGLCTIVMTFTDTACDCAESLPIEIVAGLKQIEGIEDVRVEVTWSTTTLKYKSSLLINRELFCYQIPLTAKQCPLGFAKLKLGKG